MIKAGIRDARQHLTEYLSKVQKGEDVIITKRNEPIAKISPIKKKIRNGLVNHKALRKSIIAKGKSMSQIIVDYRKEGTY